MLIKVARPDARSTCRTMIVSGPSWVGLFWTPMPASSTLNCPLGFQLQGPLEVVKDDRLERLNVVNGALVGWEPEGAGELVSVMPDRSPWPGSSVTIGP